jgi:hypothetical protein
MFIKPTKKSREIPNQSNCVSLNFHKVGRRRSYSIAGNFPQTCLFKLEMGIAIDLELLIRDIFQNKHKMFIVQIPLKVIIDL